MEEIVALLIRLAELAYNAPNLICSHFCRLGFRWKSHQNTAINVVIISGSKQELTFKTNCKYVKNLAEDVSRIDVSLRTPLTTTMFRVRSE